MKEHSNGASEKINHRGWFAFLIVATVCGMSAWGMRVGDTMKTLATIAETFYLGNQSNGNGKGHTNGTGQTTTP